MNNEENFIDLPKKKEDINNTQENNINNGNMMVKEEPVLETINSNPLPNENTLENPTELVTPTPELATQPVTMATDPVEPQNNTNNLVTPILEPVVEQNNIVSQDQVDQGEKLKKKLVVEKPVKKIKNEGNPVVGFFALLIILGIIIAAFYYFISQGIIKLPDNIKIPFIKTTNVTTTTYPTTTTAPIQNEEDTIKVSGLYEELLLNVCPEKPLTLTLNDDKTFTYNNLSFINNECINNDISGTFIENDNIITLSHENGNDIIINILIEDDKKVLSIPVNDNFIKLHKVS